MNDHLKQFANHAAYQAAESSLDTPNVSLCVSEGDVHYNPYVPHDYSQDYLTFVALETGTFKFRTENINNIISYSIDNGTTWTQGKNVSVTNGDKVMWKGTMTSSSSGIGKFSSTGNFDVQGNIMSLLFGDNYKGQTDLTGKNYAFYELFKNNTKVVNAENLSLPAETLTLYCYSGMFNGCTNLITTPKLQATTLVGSCYSDMFTNCTNLTIAPELPATTLAKYCYVGMFDNCTSLTTAPELPATTLVQGCYNGMFEDCTNLNYIKAMFITTPSSTYTSHWVRGVAASGTFVKNDTAQWEVSDVNGIPNGWTVETASE